MQDFFPSSNPSRLNWSWRDFAKTVPDPNAPAGDPVSPAGWRIWLGDVDAGLFLKFKGSESSWNEAAPSSESVRPPSSWAGANLTSGSLNISQIGENVQILATSGSSLDLTVPLVFNFTFHVTPVKGDYTYSSEGKYEHYVSTRHFHIPYGQWTPQNPCIDLKVNSNLNITTFIIHQSDSLNPYIDYPFHPNILPSLEEFVRNAEKCNVGVQLYYTVGQLSNHAVELFALSGMNGEILLRDENNSPPPPGPVDITNTARRRLGMGGNLSGNEWLINHMRSGYEGGWFTMNPVREFTITTFTQHTHVILETTG